jgi:hypothetical protein
MIDFIISGYQKQKTFADKIMRSGIPISEPDMFQELIFS